MSTLRVRAPEKTDPHQGWWKTERTARHVGLTVEQVQDRCRAGVIRATKTGKGWRIPPVEVWRLFEGALRHGLVEPCRYRAMPGDIVGAACHQCGHTNYVHGNPHSAVRQCGLCEIQAAIGALRRALADVEASRG